MAAGIQFNGIPLFSDRGSALLTAISRHLPDAIVRFCTRHILDNVKSEHLGACPVDIKAAVYRIQAAETQDEYLSILATLRLTDGDVADYIAAIAPERWTMHPDIIQDLKLYDWRSTNFVESCDNAAISVRFMFLLQFFTAQMEQLMDGVIKSQKDVDKWRREGRVVNPYAASMIKKQSDAAGYFEVRASSRTTGFVRVRAGLHVQRRIGIDKKTCTCAYMRQYGLPCRHYIASLTFFEKLDRLYDSCDP